MLFLPVEPINFLQPLEDLTLKECGLKGTFTCHISKTGLRAEWFKGDKPIRPSDKYEMTVDGGIHSLIINEADEKDEDKYTIKFKDTDVTSTANLYVKGQ